MSFNVFFCECECANFISKANFNLIIKTDLFICLHIMFQISFQNSEGQKRYRKFFGVRSELLLRIHIEFISMFATIILLIDVKVLESYELIMT